MINNHKHFGIYTGKQLSKNLSLGSLLFIGIPPKANGKCYPNSLSSKDSRLKVILIKKGILLNGLILKKTSFFIVEYILQMQ